MKLLTKARTTDEPNERELRNRTLAYGAACESIVLLENNGTLPLQNKTVAVYGAGAAMTVKGGKGSGDVNERYSVTVLEGLENRGFTVTTKQWLSEYAAEYTAGKQAFEKKRRRELFTFRIQYIMDTIFASYYAPAGRPITDRDIITSGTDTCIYVLRREVNEGDDRRPVAGDYCISPEELGHIRTCAAAYRHFVLVINCGSSMDLSALDGIKGIGAVVYLCLGGCEGGNALADILSGAVTPSGKLTDTWAKHYDQIPFGGEYGALGGDTQSVHYKEDIYVGYRYFDTFGVQPRYPFGHGLSYTDFSLRSGGITVDGSRVTVRCDVRNTGSVYSGMETVQLYVSSPQVTVERAYQALASFAKTDLLAPNERETLTLEFDLEDLAAYREADACYILEAGDYILRLGGSSRSTVPIGAVTLDREVIVSRHANLFPMDSAMETLHAPRREQESLHPGLPRVAVSADAFQTVEHTYPALPVYPNERVRKFTEKLSVKDMAEIVVGIGMFGGTKRFNLPGAVGNTTSKFWSKGLANMTLCDGPAGLRIQRRSTVSKNGSVKAVELAMEAMELLPKMFTRFLKGNPDTEPVVYQYTTAFPVTAALAQSWNEHLVYAVGKAVAEEMAEYGCACWLAPAVNIRRNPLCGRNFEYYSEDPHLTGVLAAVMTRGVQHEAGYYATVKHFAANNQEFSRNLCSSQVTERALREIYLRPFEYAVRWGGAKAIMTSYNKINGVYAPNSHDLCTKLLRNEWGFDGIVMTDWFSTNSGRADTAKAIAAGNDLIMPGGRSFKKKIIKAVRDGSLPEEALRRCCANVVHSILNSAIQREYLD